MNPLPALAVYAALQRAAGEPLYFPGTERRRTVREAVDVDLVARALGWAATAADARGGTFNLTGTLGADVSVGGRVCNTGMEDIFGFPARMSVVAVAAAVGVCVGGWVCD